MAEDNQVLGFLSPEEWTILDQLIGNKHKTLAAVHAKLYISDFETKPRKKRGILCIVLNLKNEATNFQMYCLDTNLFLWSKSTPKKPEEYIVLDDELHLFKPDDSLFHFKFQSNEEGKAFATVINRLHSKRRNSDKLAIKKTSGKKNIEKSINKFSKSESDLTAINKENKPKRQKAKNLRTRFEGELREEKKKLNKKIRKEDIGLPFDFRHVSHVGWDANKGFDGHGEALLDPQLKEFFARAGISEVLLQDPETRVFIYDFLEAHGGIESVKEEMSSNTNKEHLSSLKPDQVITTLPMPPEIDICSNNENNQPSVATTKCVRETPIYLENLKTKIAHSGKFKQISPTPLVPPLKKLDPMEPAILKVELANEKFEDEKPNNNANNDRRPETVYYSSLPREKKVMSTERFSLNTPGKMRVTRPAPPLPPNAVRKSEMPVTTTILKTSDQPTPDLTKTIKPTEFLDDTISLKSQVWIDTNQNVSELKFPLPTTASNSSELLVAVAEEKLVDKELDDIEVVSKFNSEGQKFTEELNEKSLKVEENELSKPVPAPRKKSSMPL